MEQTIWSVFQNPVTYTLDQKRVGNRLPMTSTVHTSISIIVANMSVISRYVNKLGGMFTLWYTVYGIPSYLIYLVATEIVLC